MGKVSPAKRRKKDDQKPYSKKISDFFPSKKATTTPSPSKEPNSSVSASGTRTLATTSPSTKASITAITPDVKEAEIILISDDEVESVLETQGRPDSSCGGGPLTPSLRDTSSRVDLFDSPLKDKGKGKGEIFGQSEPTESSQVFGLTSSQVVEDIVLGDWDEETSIQGRSCPSNSTDFDDLEEFVDLTADSGACPECNMCLQSLHPDVRKRHLNDCIGAGPPLKADTSLSKRLVPNILSEMMNKERENAATDAAFKEAEVDFVPAAERRIKMKAKYGNEGARKRDAPFYKVLEGMPIAVDAFQYGGIPRVTAYLLTHAHSDHYTALSSTWKHGPIYCSKITANIISHKLGVKSEWIKPLPLDIPTVLPDTGGIEVTLIEANHCPGSVLFFFEGHQTVHAGDAKYRGSHIGTKRIFRYLHCGDFRACPAHVLHPAIKGKKLDLLYLDTTYLDAKYCFPPQTMVIDACADMAKRISLAKPPQSVGTKMLRWLVPSNSSEEGTDNKDKTLFVVGTYSIGKERIFKAIAETLNSMIYCTPTKRALLDCSLDDPSLQARLTHQPLDAQVHVVPLNDISADRMHTYLSNYRSKFSKIVAIRPSGWTYTPPRGTVNNLRIPQLLSRDSKKQFTADMLRLVHSHGDTVAVCHAPYSEHSSFFELTCFALSMDWERIIPTVNVATKASRDKMQKWLDAWRDERKRRKGCPVHHRTSDYW